VDPAKRERRFLEAVRQSGLVLPSEVERALAFQKFAHARGKPLPLDRILIKFGVLDKGQVEALYRALEYFICRKEDKLYAKIAVKNMLITAPDVNRCLKEQKKAFKERNEVKRVNRIAFEKGLMSPKEDRALVAKLKEIKPSFSLPPLPLNGGSRGPAKKGEEEEWRKEVRAREIEELQNASGIHGEDSSDRTDRFEEPELPKGDSSHTARLGDDDLAGLEASPEELEPIHLSAEEDDSLADPVAPDHVSATDDDLDPLWAEADLDDVELDSEQRDAAKRSSSASSAEDETDLF
jgi:hypothetical protein